LESFFHFGNRFLGLAEGMTGIWRGLNLFVAVLIEAL
jgi:hypothetical protein